MKTQIHQWLPRIMGCHCRPERTLCWRGKRLPVCARCTGVLFGAAASLVVRCFYSVPVGICFLLLLPMIVDGFIQRVTAYESHNYRRVWTGCLGGFAAVSLFLWTVARAVLFGYRLGLQMFT